MSSFRTLARKMRQEAVPIYHENDRNVFEAAVLEIAHALRRGRKPASCSVLPDENLQAWLHRTFVETDPHYQNHMGEECSLADDVGDILFGWYYGSPDAKAILRAIAICRKYVRRTKLPSDVGGDWQYQERNKITNRKRKAEWLRLKMGSCYDDNDYRDIRIDVMWDELGLSTLARNIPEEPPTNLSLLNARLSDEFPEALND